MQTVMRSNCVHVGSVENAEVVPCTSHTAAISSEHSYSILKNPRTLKRDAAMLAKQLNSCKKKLKTTQQTGRRLQRRVELLTDVITALG